MRFSRKHLTKTILLITLIGTFVQFVSCDANGDFILFSIENDKELGAQMAAQIEANPAEFPILSRAAYPEAYSYLEDMRNEILNNANLTYRTEFGCQPANDM